MPFPAHVHLFFLIVVKMSSTLLCSLSVFSCYAKRLFSSFLFSYFESVGPGVCAPVPSCVLGNGSLNFFSVVVMVIGSGRTDVVVIVVMAVVVVVVVVVEEQQQQ